MKETRKIVGQQFFRAQFDKSTIDKTNRTVDVVFATEREVTMYNWNIGLFREVLVCDNGAGDLSRLNNRAPLLDTHAKYSVKDILGVVERAWFDNGVGRATVRFSKREDVEPVWQDVLDGVTTGISVGYTPMKYEVTEEEGKLPLYRAVKWQASEISLAPVQADQDAAVGRSENKIESSVEIISNNQKNNTMNRSSEILKLVRAAALSMEFAQTLIDDEAITVDKARTMIDAEKLRTAAPPPKREEALQETFEQMQVRAKKEGNKRAVEILNSVRAAKLDVDFANELIIDETVTVESARAKIIEKMTTASTQTKPTHAANPGVDVTAEGNERFRDAATTGMILRGGQVPEKDFKPEQLVAGRSFQGTSLIRFAALCLERAGINTSGLSDMEIAKRAITSSTSDFPVVLENVLHKMLLASYAIVPDTWRQFCVVGSVTDFRAHKRLRPGSLSRLDKVKENGELKNKPIPDATSESITAETFGNIINISRNMIINDDIGYFGRLTSDLGRAAARGIEIDVYALLASNPTMGDGVVLFHTDHGNVISGAAPSVASFDAYKVKMASQKDHSNNDILDIKPTLLLLGVGQAAAADAINDSMYDPDASNKFMKKNTSYKSFSKIISTARIADNKQYAFADPSVLPVLEVAFLNGVQTPYLEQEQAFDQLGLRWRVYTDYAVGAIDWKGAVYNPGA